MQFPAMVKVKPGEVLMFHTDDGVVVINSEFTMQFGEAALENTWVRKNESGGIDVSVCPAGCVGIWDERLLRDTG